MKLNSMRNSIDSIIIIKYIHNRIKKNKIRILNIEKYNRFIQKYRIEKFTITSNYIHIYINQTIYNK